MPYSNGYDLTAVITALTTRIGFRQPTDSGAVTLTDPVKQSDSGRYYQDFHALVTVNNIKSVMEDANADATKLNAYLDSLEKGIIARCLNGLFTGPEIIEQVKLYQRTGYNDRPIEDTANFVGFEIDVAKKFDTGVQIDALTILLNGAKTFNIYCFKDGDPTVQWTQSVTTVANVPKTVLLTDKVLGQGKWFIGYFQEDLGLVNAIREQVECWAKTLLFNARSMQAPKTGATSFDRNSRYQTTFDNYGLNLEISSFKDHTQQIVRKAAAFDELIGLQMAYGVIEQVIYAVRNNGTERILKDQLDKIGIQLDLNGAAPISDSPQVMGLKQRIERELKKVKGQFYPASKAQTVSVC